MSELAAFQDRFVDALRSGASLTARDTPSLRRGLAVHRNTVFKALIDALADNYPTVVRLVGEEWFAASAREFLSAHMPQEASLATVGAFYPEFLRTLPATVRLPYLPGVARLDRLWTEAHVAADAEAVSPERLAALGADGLFDLRLPLHPAARIEWFDEPAPTIWRLNRPPAPASGPTDGAWTAQGALVARPRGEVEMLILERAGFVFLEQCHSGAAFGDAARAALEFAPETDVTSHIARFIAFGAFMASAGSAYPAVRESQ